MSTTTSGRLGIRPDRLSQKLQSGSGVVVESVSSYSDDDDNDSIPTCSTGTNTPNISFDGGSTISPNVSFETVDESVEVSSPPRGSTTHRKKKKSTSSPIRSRSTIMRTERNNKQRVNVAKPQHIDNNNDKNNSNPTIRTKDIVRIFTNDDDEEFIEITPEQLQRVKMMHKRISSGTKFSFNYNVLLFVASILAGLGLVSNSNATIIASMLVSPIMGPVIGLAYGTTIRDYNLVYSSMKTEFISLLYCIIAGIIIGAITGPTSLSDNWPTPEMDTRGTMSTFIVGLPTAFFSGLGVAVSILDDQTASLVGVAISASLLPPAVNAGIMWIAYAFTKADIIPPGKPELLPLVPIEVIEPTPVPVDYDNYYGGNNDNYGDVIQDDDVDEEIVYDLSDYSKRGLLSLCLTLANIALIWISSMLMFRIKEVLPIADKKVFWEDLGIARKVYQKRALIQHTRLVEKSSIPPNSGLHSSNVTDKRLGIDATPEGYSLGSISEEQDDDDDDNSKSTNNDSEPSDETR